MEWISKRHAKVVERNVEEVGPNDVIVKIINHQNGKTGKAVNFYFTDDIHNLITDTEHLVLSRPTDDNRIYFQSADQFTGYKLNIKLIKTTGKNKARFTIYDVDFLNEIISHKMEGNYELKYDSKLQLYYIRGLQFLMKKPVKGGARNE